MVLPAVQGPAAKYGNIVKNDCKLPPQPLPTLYVPLLSFHVQARRNLSDHARLLASFPSEEADPTGNEECSGGGFTPTKEGEEASWGGGGGGADGMAVEGQVCMVRCGALRLRCLTLRVDERSSVGYNAMVGNW